MIDAAQHLTCRERAHDEIAPVAVDARMPRENGERNPERELQLEMIEVLEPMGENAKMTLPAAGGTRLR